MRSFQSPHGQHRLDLVHNLHNRAGYCWLCDLAVITDVTMLNKLDVNKKLGPAGFVMLSSGVTSQVEYRMYIWVGPSCEGATNTSVCPT